MKNQYCCTCARLAELEACFEDLETEFYRIHGADITRRERLKLRERMGVVAFATSFPEWERELLS